MCQSRSSVARRTHLVWSAIFSALRSFAAAILILSAGGLGGCGGGSRGTGFEVTGRVVVSGSEAPVAGALVTVTESGETAVTDADGQFDLFTAAPAEQLKLDVETDEVSTVFNLRDIPQAATGVRLKLLLDRGRRTINAGEIEFFGGSGSGGSGSSSSNGGPKTRPTPRPRISPSPTPTPVLPPPLQPTPSPDPTFNPPPDPSPQPSAPPPTATPSATPTATPSPTPVDRTAPQIVSRSVTNIAQTSADLNVTTDEPASVGASTTSIFSAGGPQFFSAGPSLSHVISLTGLSPGTQYTLSIGVTDTAGNLRTDNNTTFRTLDTPPPPPPPPPTASALYWADDKAQELARADVSSGTRETLFSGTGGPVSAAFDPGRNKIYTTDGNSRKIIRSNVDGTNPETVVQLSLSELPASNSIFIALDAQRDRIYWVSSDYMSVSSVISRLNTDGTGRRAMFTAAGRVTNLVLDPAQQKLYWLRDNLSVWRANVDGTGLQQLASFSGFPAPNYSALLGLSLDDVHQKLYWQDFVQGNIWRSNLDGTGAAVAMAFGPLGVGGDNSVIQGFAFDSQADKIYWADSGRYRVQSANLDGTGRTTLTPNTGFAPYYFIMIDRAQRKLYFGPGMQLGVMIQRMNLDGSGLESIDKSTVLYPEAIAVDGVHNKMYWRQSNGIFRANLDKTGVERLLDSPKVIGGMSGIALDPAGGKMYWNDDWTTTSPLRIRRANLDGSSPEDIVTYPDSDSIGNVAFDPVAHQLYWTYHDGISRSNADGSGVQLILTATEAGAGARDLTIDPLNRKLYWTDVTNQTISRANLDGTNKAVLLSRLTEPKGIVVDAAAGYIYWTEGSYYIERKIRRARLDGTGVVDLDINGLETPTYLALPAS